jgi:hypothetical protein
MALCPGLFKYQPCQVMNDGFEWRETHRSLHLVSDWRYYHTSQWTGRCNHRCCGYLLSRGDWRHFRSHRCSLGDTHHRICRDAQFKPKKPHDLRRFDSRLLSPELVRLLWRVLHRVPLGSHWGDSCARMASVCSSASSDAHNPHLSQLRESNQRRYQVLSRVRETTALTASIYFVLVGTRRIGLTSDMW